MARRSTNIRLPWSREMDDGSPSYKHPAPLEPDIDDRSEFYKHLVPLGPGIDRFEFYEHSATPPPAVC